MNRPKMRTDSGRIVILCGMLLLLVALAGFLVHLGTLFRAFSEIAASEISPKPTDLAEEIGQSLIWTNIQMWSLVSGVVRLIIGFVVRWRGRRKFRKREAG